MTIIPADNILYSGTLAGDPWPGSSDKTELSDSSEPPAALFNKNANGEKLMNHSITDIVESDDGLISFIFDEEALRIPSIFPKKDEECTYDLQGRRCPMPNDRSSLPRGIYILNRKKLMIR